MLKDYYIPTVPVPGADAKLSAFLSSFDEHYDGLALGLDETESAQSFFSRNYDLETGSPATVNARFAGRG
ncbi:MAG: hypothetical protein GC138_02295 [Gammaproteobacteria bacterium]|nr:hypothetical protein [Gammaproteobacteria bacterium]